jgi:two-component system LytT family response regulator
VVDDESLARRNITVLLRRDPDIGSVVECASGLDAIDEIRNSKPDLVFLDVQMPECDGFDVLELLGSDLPPTIIFVTAHDEYALRAFDAGALDYLLKPFDDARFGRALSRAKEKLAYWNRGSGDVPSGDWNRGSGDVPSGDYRPPQPRAAERLVVKSQGQVLFLSIADIDWIEAAGYYVCLHVGSDTHILRRSLSELEQDLGDEKFIRIHRSIVVNLERIRGLQLQTNGEYEVVLQSKVRLRLSRRYRKRLQDRMGAMSGHDSRQR